MRRARPVTRLYPQGRHLTLAAMGDSLTHNIALRVLPSSMWPERLAVGLRALGCPIKARNFGRSGNTSTQMIARMPVMTQHDVPILGIIMAGVNDPGSGINQATTQANIEAMVNTLMAAGTQYVVVVSTQYLNWASGGDTTGTAEFSGSGYGAVRTAERDAAVAREAVYPDRVVYCSLFNYMKALIVSGAVTQGADTYWHTSVGNQHLNAVGEQIVADAVLATIQAQSGWITALGGVGA
jgi:lysophospholipase L1-like esterase